jgi:RNA binding exosome subunit
MKQEDKELLVSLLNKADDDSKLHIYDDKENIYEVDWIFLDNNDICIKIKSF